MNSDRQAETPLLRTTEAARLLGVQPNTMKIWRRRGTGPAFHRLGSGRTSPVAYSLADLQAWLDERRYTSTSAEAAQREMGAT